MLSYTKKASLLKGRDVKYEFKVNFLYNRDIKIGFSAMACIAPWLLSLVYNMRRILLDFVQGIAWPKDVFYKKVDTLTELLKFDNNTYIHSQNVARYSTRLNKLLSTNIDDRIMYYSGLFHDIGKLKINLSILNKEDKLQDSEFDIIKKHSGQGYIMLKKYLMPKEMQHSALYHHERWDGKGYPMKLKGEEIPVVARIISICDVYDALTSDRPYRNAFAIDEAVNMMKNFKGQFDPEIFKVFMDNLDSIVGM